MCHPPAALFTAGPNQFTGSACKPRFLLESLPTLHFLFCNSLPTLLQRCSLRAQSWCHWPPSPCTPFWATPSPRQWPSPHWLCSTCCASPSSCSHPRCVEPCVLAFLYSKKLILFNLLRFPILIFPSQVCRAMRSYLSLLQEARPALLPFRQCFISPCCPSHSCFVPHKRLLSFCVCSSACHFSLPSAPDSIMPCLPTHLTYLSAS